MGHLLLNTSGAHVEKNSHTKHGPDRAESAHGGGQPRFLGSCPVPPSLLPENMWVLLLSLLPLLIL